MPDNRRIYQPDQAHSHETPRSARQTPRQRGPVKRGGMSIAIPAGNRIRPEQTPKRDRIGK